MEQIQNLLNNNNPDYFYSVVILLGSIGAMSLIRYVLLVRLESLTSKSKTTYDDLIIRFTLQVMSWPLILVVALNLALIRIDLTGNWLRYVYKIDLLLLIYFVVNSINLLVRNLGEKKLEQMNIAEKRAESAMLRLVLGVVRFVIVLLGILFAMQNLGFDISALLAGVGVGGIAIAFALQRILEDIFSSISIYFDAPFRVGDFIKFGDESGSVKQIGLKSTRLKTFTGDELVVSNRELSTAHIHNFGKLDKRQVKESFKVDFANDHKLLPKIPELIQKCVQKQDQAVFEHASLVTLADTGVVYEFSYTLNSKSFTTHLEVKQQILLAILDSLKKSGIKLAQVTPTTTVKK